MVHLTCDCLNIRIHAKLVAEADHEVVDSDLSDPFFEDKLSSVALNLAGITKEMPRLVKSRPVKDYNVFSCVNCKKDVYAVSTTRGEETILASTKLKSDPNELHALMESENYSPLFKIIVRHKPPSPQTKKSLALDLNTRRSESLEKTLNSLQQQLTRFLQSEQEALDERIRSYIEQQKSVYATLQSRVRRDKQTIASLLLESEEHDLQNSLSDAMIDTTPGLTPPMTPVSQNQSGNSPTNEFQEQLNFEDRDKVVGEITKPPLVRQRPQSFNRPLHGKIRRKGVYSQPRVAQSLDTDGIFDLDGVDEELSPFYRSDDDLDIASDEMSSDDVFTATDVIRSGQMSLPVNMPKFTRRSHIELESDDDDEKTRIPDDPAQIVASIKAMSRSIHQSDTTEMFGDLPRPRLNTMN